jgi:hypothetical protein
METDLIIGLVLVGLMIAYIIGGVVNNGSEALLGCLIPVVIVGGVGIGIFLLSGGWIYILGKIMEYFGY